MNHVNRTLLLTVIIALLAFAFYGIYQYGKATGKGDMQTTLIENYQLVKKIAELSTLQVQGTSEMKVTNEETGGLIGSIKNSLFENTYLLKIPFTAKYGVDLQNFKLEIQQQQQTVLIYLPKAKLLSFELQLNFMQVFDKKGLLVLNNNLANQDYQKKLYTNSRKNLELKEMYVSVAELQVATLLTQYFKPCGLQVEIYFDGILLSTKHEATIPIKN